MGQRCNLAILEGGQFELYYDHWAANRLDVELFWGPEIARAFIKQRDPDPNSWLDDRWCEGGCVLDFDTKHLLWYGGESVLYGAGENLTHHELMINQWPGWQIEWAYDGIFQFAAKLGVSRETVASDRRYDIEPLSYPRITRGPLGTFYYTDGVISYSSSGKSGYATVNNNQFSLLNAALTKETLLAFVDGFPHEKFQKQRLEDKDWPGFEWGAHFDFDQRRIDFWYPNPTPGFPDAVKARWGTFSIQFHGPDYRWHNAIFPELEFPSLDAGAKKARLTQLKASIDRDDENPAIRTLDALKEEMPGSEIQVNPSVLSHRSQNQKITRDKLAIIEALLAAL